MRRLGVGPRSALASGPSCARGSVRLKRTVQGCFHEQPIGDGGDPAAIRVMRWPGREPRHPTPDVQHRAARRVTAPGLDVLRRVRRTTDRQPSLTTRGPPMAHVRLEPCPHCHAPLSYLEGVAGSKMDPPCPRRVGGRGRPEAARSPHQGRGGIDGREEDEGQGDEERRSEEGH